MIRYNGVHRRAALLAMLVVALAGLLLAPPDAGAQTDLQALVKSMPEADRDGKYTGPDPAETREKVYDVILKRGAGEIAALVGMVKEPGEGDDFKALYVLHGITMYVGREGAERERRLFAAALAETLRGAAPQAVKGCVIEELRLVGGEKELAAVGKFLNDKELYAAAGETLLAIGGAEEIFCGALSRSRGKARLTIVQALGVLRSNVSVKNLIDVAGDDDRDLRLAALDALGNIGDPRAAETLLAACDATNVYERNKACDAVLVLAERLLEAQKKPEAASVYSRLWEKRSDAPDRHVRIAALRGLIGSRDDVNDLLAGLKADDIQVRSVAIGAAAAVPGRAATLKYAGLMKQADADLRVGLLAVLGARRDPAGLPATLEKFGDAEEPVRLAAMDAAAAIGGEDATRSLVAAAGRRQGAERDAAFRALSRVREPQANAIVAASFMRTSAETSVRAGLLGVLANRIADDQRETVLKALEEDERVIRQAALKALGALASDPDLPKLAGILKTVQDKGERHDAENCLKDCAKRIEGRTAEALVAALEGAAPANGAAMLRVLGSTRNDKAMDALVKYANNSNAELKDAAVRALKDMNRREAAQPLLEIARTSGDEKHQILALQGAIRLARDQQGDEKKVAVLAEALKLAKRPDEKRQALSMLGDINSPDSILLAAKSLGDADVLEEAEAAVMKVADRIKRDKKHHDAVREAVGKVAETTQSKGRREKANRLLKEVGQPK